MEDDDKIDDTIYINDTAVSTITLDDMTTSITWDNYIDLTTSDTITIDINSTVFDNLSIIEPTPFVDTMPKLEEVESMCKEYPGLEKAYENFKTVYKMVEQDWRGKQDSDEDTLF